MEPFSRQIRVRGTTEICAHPDGATEEIRNYGEDVIGVRCRLCGFMFAQAWCTGCQDMKWCTVVNAPGTERFCSKDCQQQATAARAKRDMRHPTVKADRKKTRGW